MNQQTRPERLSEHGLDQLFRNARTYYRFLPKPVSDETLAELYTLARMGPTSSNINPLRIIFVKSPEAKKKLCEGVRPTNIEKVMSAPVTAVFGTDLHFYDHLELLAPHMVDRREVYIADPKLAARAAFRNSTLQAAYFLMAVRAFGMDCGPMSGFFHDIVDQTYFPDGRVESNFLMNFGYGDPSSLRPRAARFDFADTCTIL